MKLSNSKSNIRQREKYKLNRLNPEWVKKHNAKRRLYRNKYRDNLFNILGNKCINCGFDDIRALQIDHKNDNGYKERKSVKDYRDIYKKYSENPHLARKELQVLCANCNWIKRYEKDKKNREDNLKRFKLDYL